MTTDEYHDENVEWVFCFYLLTPPQPIKGIFPWYREINRMSSSHVWQHKHEEPQRRGGGGGGGIQTQI